MYSNLARRLAKQFEQGVGTQFFFDTSYLIRGENSVLGYLYEVQHGATIGELQQAARVGPGRISDLVNQLVKKKYVEKKKDAKDQRTIRVN